MSTRIHKPPTLQRCAADWPSWQAQLPLPAELARRDVGGVVTDHRTSWVRKLGESPREVFVKVYEYESWIHIARTLGRRTAPWQASRPTREFDALTWLGEHGLPAAEPLAVFEWRRLGFVQKAMLVTRAYPGEPADQVLGGLDPLARCEAAAAIGRFVARLHALGFRDGNLDLRNLLLRRSEAGWTATKIDSPRHRLVRPGRATDRAARADWSRLLPQLESLRLADVAREAATASPSEHPARQDPQV